MDRKNGEVAVTTDSDDAFKAFRQGRNIIFPQITPRLVVEYRMGRLSRRYRIGMTMHNLPETIFWAKDARRSQRQRRDIAPTANFGPEPLYLHQICQLRRHTLGYALEAGSAAVPVIRCRLLHRLDDLLPSTRERAKGIAQGYIVLLGIELPREVGFPFMNSPRAK